MESGVHWKGEKRDIEDALYKSKGRISHACKILNIARSTLYKYLDKHPELKDLIEKLRHDFEEVLLDKSENVIEYALSQMQNDLGYALKASFFTLKARGKKRGWSIESDTDKEEIGKQLSNVMSSLTRFQSMRHKESESKSASSNACSQYNNDSSS